VGVSFLFFTALGFMMMGYGGAADAAGAATERGPPDDELTWTELLSKYFLLLSGFFILPVLLIGCSIYFVGWMNKNNYFNLFMFFVFLFVFIAVVVRFFSKLKEWAWALYNNKTLGEFFRLLPGAAQDIFKEGVIHHPGKISVAVGVVVLILVVVLYYVLWHLWKVQYLWGGGKLVRNKPLTLNQRTTIGNYLELNPFPMKTTPTQVTGFNNETITIPHTAPDPEHNYRYAISFWFFIDQNAPDLRLASSKWCPIFNYGNKPLVVYRADTHTLMVVYSRNHEILHLDDSDNGSPVGLDIKGTSKEDRQKKAKEVATEVATAVDAGGVQEYRKAEAAVEDGNGKSIVYRTQNVPLQKWNNMVINYDSGIMDIFLNGQLVQSMPKQITFMSYDGMEVGSDGGMRGQVCNVTYFPQAIPRRKVDTLYHSMQWLEPPFFRTWQPNP
jgi:hypothetical protein